MPVAALPRTQLVHLECGMPLLMMENREVAVATADVWVRTGAADEPDAISGISHFLEHMLFKGTEKYGLGEIEQQIERVGGVSNAGTSHDFTHYYVTLPAMSVGVAIDMLAEMTRHSTLDEGELEKERLVILEEYRRKQDHPAGVLFERLYAELFRTGRYHNPVIGYEETIRAIDRPRMLDYYHRRYTPETMLLVVTGDIDPQEIEARANEAFAGFTRPVHELTPPVAPTFGLGHRVHETKPTGGEMYATFAFAAPGLDADLSGVLALDIAQSILGQGRAARLHQQLKEKRGLCSSISTYYPTHAAESLFVVMATCLPEQLDPLREALIQELKGFCSTEPTAEERGRALRLMDSGHRFSLETTSSMATSIGYYYTLTGDIAFHDEYLEKIHAISAAEVRAAAAAIMPPDAVEANMVEVTVGPDGNGAQA